MLKRMMILPIFLALSSCGATFQVPVWTLRSDGHLRASQRNENFSSEEFIAKIQKEENKDFALVVTPQGEAEISRHVRELESEVTQLKNDLTTCRGW